MILEEPDSHQNGLDANQMNMELNEGKKPKAYVEKITNILRIYMKILMGRDLEDLEHNAFYSYLEVNPNNQTDQIKSDVQQPLQPKQFETGTYVNELDYHMGDIVLSFPNPDCKEQFDKYEKVQAREAINICQKIFSTRGGEDKDVLDNLILIKAIEQCIYMLSIKQKTNIRNLKKRKKNRLNVLLNLNIIELENQKDRIEEFIQEIKNRLGNAEKQDSKTRNQTVREALQLDFKKLEDKSKYIATNGKYLTFTQGRSRDYRWFRSKNDTRDFLTLLRNITYLQLGKMGFVTRNFVSSDDKTIICVLYQSDENLKIIAEKNGITKKLNFQFSDLLSLEPIDSNLRPMRLSNRLWKPQDYDVKENYDLKKNQNLKENQNVKEAQNVKENQNLKEALITQEFSYLREKIIKCLKEINFKRIAKETNTSQLNQSLFNEGKEDLLHDEIGPTDEEWTAYYQYLKILQEKIQKQRDEFQFKNDDCLLINKVKPPFDLYLARNKEQKKEIHKLIKEQDIEDLRIGGAKGREIIETCQITVKAQHLRGIAKIQEEYINIQEKFKEVRSHLHLKKQKLIGSKHIKVCKREKLAFEYLNIFRKALKTVNNDKTLLKTLWDDVGEEPFEMYVDYTMTPAKGGFNKHNKLNSIWKKYQICETGKTSLFSNMERIKINQLCLSERVNMNPMLSKKYVLEVFCLNDFLELLGESSKQQLSDIFERKIKVQSLLDENQYEFFHTQVQQIMGTEQFVKGGLLPETVELKHNTYQSSEYSFVEPKLVNLQYIWQLNLLCPWHIPTYEIREYYGEKISLYFTFLGYYTKMLLPLGILGLAVNIFQWFIEDNLSNYYIVPTVVFGFVQVQWINLVNDLWQSEEHEFAVRYGQLHCDSQSSGGNRSDFEGKNTRSIENDQMNSLYYPDFKRIQKISTNVLIISLVFSIYASIVMGLFFMSQLLIEQYDFSNQKGFMSIIKIEVSLAATLNLIVILLCDGIYDKIATELTNYENHETISDWEMNYVFKKYFLCFLSLCGPMFFIILINDHIGLSCINNDCYVHAQYYFSTIFILQFTLNIWDIVKPMIQEFIRKVNNEEEVIEKELPKNTFFKVPSYTSQQQQLLNQNYDDPIDDPFININKFIEEESHKESYVISADRYGTVDNYMEITLQYSMLSLFGMTFPICFFIAFIWNAVEIQTDKKHLLNQSQRPLPMGEKSIGVFNGVLEILSYISLLQNSGLMTYLSGRSGNDGFGLGSLAFFLCVLNINFFLRYIESSVFAEIPYSFKALMERHKYILKSTIEKFRGGGHHGNDVDEQLHPKPYPIFKIYGCILEGGENGCDEQTEMMSSEDELEEHYILTKSQLDALREDQKKGQQQQIINYRKEPKIEDLEVKNKARKSNWALKFNYKNAKDQQVKERSKKFYQKTLQFLAKLEQLTTHKIIWADDRISERNFFISRSKILIRNLDWRKVLILQDNHKNLLKHHERAMRRKYDNKMLQIAENPELEQNKLDHEEIISKSNKYIEKHSWLDCRKLIYLRIQGVWFNSSRKYTKPTNPLKVMKRYQKLHELYKIYEAQILRENKTDISVEEQFKRLTNDKGKSHLKDVNFKDFSEMMEQITPEPLTFFTVQLSSRKPTALEMLVDSSKSLWHKLLSRPLGQLSYGLQSEIESQAIELYLNEIVSNNNIASSINPTQGKSPMIPTTARLHLIKMLDRRGQRIKQVIRTHIDTFRWLASNDRLDNTNLEAISILLYTEVGYSYGAHRALINNVLRFNAYRSVPGSIPVKGSLVVPYINYISYNASDPLDRIDAFLCKGYVARSYGLQQGYFINGLTLRDVLQLRSKLDLSYNDMETLQFLLCAIKTLDILDTQFGMFHGMISPASLYLVGGWDSVDAGASSYALIDIGMIYWYDNRTQQAQFLRGIGQDEIWFTSPEVMRSHFSSNSPPFEPLKADIYSLGLVVLEMMTLGRMSIELSKNLKANDGDVEATFIQWLNNNGDALDEVYPLTFKLIYEMIDSNPINRSLPRQICMKHQLTQYADRSLSTYLYSLQEYPDVLKIQLNRYKSPKIKSLQIVRIFNPEQSQPQQSESKSSQVQLGDFLKEYLHRINFYLRVKSNGKAIEYCTLFEKTLKEDILIKMPFQKAKDSFIQMVEIYLVSQLYELLLQDERMKEMINIFKYIHQKTQVLFQGSQLDEALTLGTHLIRLYSIVCIKITDSQRDSKKQNDKGTEILALESKYDESGEKRKQFLQDIRTKKQLLPYLMGLRQKLLVMTENMDTLFANIFYILGDLVKAQEKVSRLSDQKFQVLATEKETLKQFQAKEENTNNSIEFKMFYVTTGFASQLSKYLNLRMLKMKIETDLNKQLNSDSNKNLTEELEILKSLLCLSKLQQFNSNNQKKILFQTLNFTQLLPQLRLSLLNFIKSLALDCQRMFLSNKIRLMRFEPTETKSLQKLLQENEWCIFAPYATQCRRTLLEWAITQKSDQIYDEIANIVTTQLTSLYLQDRLFKKFSHLGYHYLVSHLQYAQIFMEIAPLLQYLPAPQLLQLSSQAIELVSSYTQYQYAKQIVFMALYLRLIGVQYVPTLHYSTIGDRKENFENSNFPNSQSIIQQCKLLAMQCNIINQKNEVSWTKANVLNVFKLNYLWLSLYSYGSIHPDNNQRKSIEYNKFKSTLDTIQKSLEQSHGISFALEMSFKKAQLELTNEEPIELENYQTLVASLSQETTQLYMNLAQPWLCYLVSVQSYTAQVKWKDFINSNQFKWAMGNQTYNFIVALLQLLLNAQQHDLVRHIAQILLIALPHSMLMHKECGRNTREIYLLWALATEQIDNTQKKTGQNFFNTPVNQNNQNISLKDILGNVLHEQSLNLLLVQPIGDESANIQIAFNNIVKIKGVSPIVLTTFQVALKLVIYYYENAYFDKAVNLATNLEKRIFNKIQELMQVVIPEYHAQRIFIPTFAKELSQEQLCQILKISLQEEQRQEFQLEFQFINDDVCLQKVLEIDLQAEYQQLIALRGLIRGTQAALAVAHMRIGNIQITMDLAVHINGWKKHKSESQLNLLLLNFSMQISNTMWEHDQGYLASKQMIHLFNQLNCNQYLNIEVKKSAKTFKTCTIDESALLLIPHSKIKAYSESDDEPNPNGDFQLLFNCLSYEETMDDTNFLGIVSLNDIKVSAYIGCFECILNDSKQLHSAVQSSFAIQKFISQTYGIQSFYYARSAQNVSVMYLQFCSDKKQIKVLEKELCVDQVNNLRQLRGERRRLIRWYIEERVNGKTTNEIEDYFKMMNSKLNEAILVGEEISKGKITRQAVIRWALTAADEALRIYEQLGGSHYLMAYVNLLKSDCYLFQEKVLMANECLQQSKDIMNSSYPKSGKHPDFVVLYIKQALSRQFIRECLQSQVQTLIKLRSINTVTQMNSIFDLMQCDKTMLKFFDDYRNHGFNQFLENGLKQFFEQKQSFKRGKTLDNLEVNRKDHKDIIHLIEEAARQKDLNSRKLDNLFDQCQKALKRDKLKVDFIGVEELDQAMQQCQALFKSYNNKLYKRVDELLKKAKAQQFEWDSKF